MIKRRRDNYLQVCIADNKNSPRNNGIAAHRGGKMGTIMPVGTIKFFNDEKGFGFIAPETGDTDVFVHLSALRSGGSLAKGTKVAYDLGQDRKTGKAKAENVRIL